MSEPSTSAAAAQQGDEEVEFARPADPVRRHFTAEEMELCKHFEVETHNASWMEFVKEELDGKIQEVLFISPHHTAAFAPVRWCLLVKMQVIISKKNKCEGPAGGNPYHPLQVESFNVGDSEKISVRCLCAHSTNQIFKIDFEDIVLEKSKIGAVWNEITANVLAKLPWLPTDLIYPIEDWQRLEPVLDKSACEMIEKGMILELQLEENPQYVVRAVVIHNYQGLLVVKYGKGYVRVLHMTSIYLHQVGWVDRMKRANYQAVDYVPGTKQNLPTGPPVPEYVLWKNGLPFQYLDEDVMVAFLDHDRRRFFFAHVTFAHIRKEDKHFFNLIVGKDLVLNPKTGKPMFFHTSHEQVFCYKLLRKNGVEVHLPIGFTVPPEDDNDDRDGILKYHQYFFPRGSPLKICAENIGSHWKLMSLWKDLDSRRQKSMLEKVKSLEYVEMLLPTDNGLMQMQAAKVEESSLHLLTLTLATRKDVIYAHPYDPAIFPFGAATDMNAFIFTDVNVAEGEKQE